MSTTVIVGASIGGIRTAQSLRTSGYDGNIIVFGDEREEPYDRPPLSKGVLAGTKDVESIRLLTTAEAEAADIQLVLGTRATGIRVDTSEVQFDGHAPISYDNLVVATGTRARRSQWDGGPGVHVVRTLDDARNLRRELIEGGDVVIVGAGFIGTEVASTARALGCEVTIVNTSPAPMGRALSTEFGRWFGELQQRNGVSCRFGVRVTGLTRDRGRFAISLSDGSAVSARVVVLGLGAVPNDDWLRSSGLAVADGLLCDEFCRATGTSNVFAVGDISRWHHRRHGRSVRSEHWTNAVEQATVVAHNLCQPSDLREHTPVEYAWTDQYDWKIQFVGHTRTPEGIIAGDPTVDGRFAILHSHDGASMCGATVVNWPRALMVCRRVLRGSASLSEVRDEIEQRCGETVSAAAGRIGTPS